MKKRFTLIFLIFLILPCSLAAETITASEGIINLSSLDSGTNIIALEGDWGFYWNTLHTEIPETTETFMKVPGNWASQNDYPVSGYTTYTLRLKGLISGELYQIYIPESISAYRLYLNGEEVSSNGMVGTNRKESTPLFRPETILFTAKAGSETLALQVSNFHYRKSGIWRNFYIGKPSVISAYRQGKMILETFLIGLMTFVTIYHLGLFFFRREEKAELFFGIVCFVILLRLLTTGEQMLTYLIPRFPWEVARRLEFLPFSVAAASCGFYFQSLYPEEFSKNFLKIYTYASCFFGFVFLILPVRISNHFILLAEVFLFIGLAYSVIITVNAFRHKRNGALLILISIGILILSVLNDILYSNLLINSVYATPWGFILFIVTQSLMLSRRYSISFRTIENLTLNLKDTNKSMSRFVPFQFLEYMNKSSIMEVELGDQVLKNMTILFADIRSFTTLSEVMSPEENFKFLNSFLSQVVPVIRENGGFVDKFIGDGIMALFPQASDDGLHAAISLQKAVHQYNDSRSKAGYRAIKLGVGLHSGGLMLGTIGEVDRMETTVISDTVNIASRMEMLTKNFGASIIISKNMYDHLERPMDFSMRYLGSTKVKGKRRPINLIEILDGLPEMERLKKLETRDRFEEGVQLFETLKIIEAKQAFHDVLTVYPADTAASLFIERCEEIECLD